MTDSLLNRILLVEDNPGDALLLRVMLREARLDTVTLETAASLTEAVDLLKSGEPPLILLDLSLPDSWGPQTYLAIRDAAPDSPIVILTGLADEAVSLELVREGAQDYLVKGHFDQGMLARVVRYAWERQRIEKELVRRQVWWEAVIQAIPDAVLITDRQQKVVFANSAARDLWPKDLSPEPGRDILSLFPDEAPDRNRLVEFLRSPGVSQTAVPFQTFISRAGPEPVPCEVHHSSFFVGGEDLDVVVLRDLSERRRLEQQLAQTQKLEAIGHLSAGVAHDFNNLLGVVVGNLDLIKRQVEGQPDLVKRIDVATAAAHRGAELTKQLL